MAHLSNSYTSFENFLASADGFWTVDLNALNSSGTDGTAVAAMGTEEDGTPYLKVSVSVTGATPNQTHPQHIHGTFDSEGNPTDAVSPTIADDADLDGLVEVLEGVGRYGDVILTLVEDGNAPVADENGNYSFIATYDLSDAANLLSPVTGTQYDMADLMPLMLREIVVHGVNVPAGIGSGTGGEADGTGGYIPILPAAAGEIEESDMEGAMALLSMQRMMAGKTITLGDGGESAFGGRGDDDIAGGAGDDFLAGGEDNDMLAGMGGNDSAFGGSGNDNISGGDGDDSVAGGSGMDVVDGNAGNDTIDAGFTDMNMENAADMGASGGLMLSDYDNGLAGGAGNDMIWGRAGDDIITGDDDSRVSDANGTTFDVNADGADTIYGGGGNDEIHGGTWSDSDQGLMNGSTGMMGDWISGGDGNDILRGAGGADMLGGDAGDDNIGGGGGDDSAFGGRGDDVVFGGDGNDVVSGSAGGDVVDGGAGNDRVDAGPQDVNIANAADMGASGGLMLSDYDNGITGGAGNDTVIGRAGDDIITGDDDSRVSDATGGAFDEMADGSDLIFGGDGNDEIHTGTWSDSDQGLPNAHMGMADDTASGGNGDDILRGAGGNDLLNGDAGNDNIGAGGGNDSAFGGTGNDVIFGGGGDDSLGGGGGMDVVDGNAGNDTVDAGATDVNMVNAADMGASGSLTLSDYDNGIAGGAGNDLIMGRAGDDIITGDDDSRVSDATGGSFDVTADGMDTIYGGGGNDEIHGGTWSDSDQGLMNGSTGMMGDWISGGDGNDILRGAGGADVLGGDAGDDNIGGGGGNDSAYGGEGTDVVNGNDGDDVIFGGGGDDFLFGGSGADSFNHDGTSDDGTDDINDFSSMDGDMLVYSGGMSMLTGDDFMVTVTDLGLGDAGTADLVVANTTTGQDMFRIADGADLMMLNIDVNGMTYDLLA